MPRSGGVFTGTIALGTYSINFINTAGVTHTIDRVILEALYTNYAAWKTTFPTVDLTPYATKANATFSTDITLGSNGIVFTNPSAVSRTLSPTILEALYTNYTIWKTSYPTIDLTPYVTNTSLTTTLGSYAKSTDLNAYVSNTSLTTTLGSYTKSTDLNAYVSSTSLTTTLGGYVSTTGLTTTLGGYVSSTGLTTTLGGYVSSTSLTNTLLNYMPKSGGVFTGTIALGTYSINFINTAGVTHTIDRVILEALYTNYATWQTTSPTVDLTPYATKANATFSTDITLGSNGIVFTNLSGVTHTLDKTILEALYTNYATWKQLFPLWI